MTTHPRSSLLAAALPLLVGLALLSSASAAAQPTFFTLTVRPPVDTAVELPACVAAGLEEDRLRYVRAPVPGSWYYCPVGGGAWVEVAGGGGGTDDQTAAEVPITDAGGYFVGTDVEAALQETPPGARAPTAHATSHQSGGSDVLSLPAIPGDLTEARISDLVHTVDTGPAPDCAGSLTYQDGEGGCDTYTLTGSTSALATWSGGTPTGECVELDASGNLVAAGAACGGGGGGDHGALTGLGDDDHTQYALVTGRPGQSLDVDGVVYAEGNTPYALQLQIGGVTKFSMAPESSGGGRLYAPSSISWQFTSTGSFTLGTSPFPTVRAGAVSGTNPNILPGLLDGDTGFGSDGADVVTVTAGGVALLRGVQNDSAADVVTLRDVLRIVPRSAAPTCGASEEGSLYSDSDTNELCYCTGSAWVGLVVGGACA